MHVDRLIERIERGRQLDPELTALVDRAIGLGEIVIEAREGIPPTRDELVRGQASVQAFHLIRWAWALLFAGGEVPAKALGRVTCEFVLLFWYAELVPARSDAWLDAERSGPAFRTIWSKVEKELLHEEPALAMLPSLYTSLSRAAHFDPLVFAYTFRWREGEPDFFPVEPRLDLLGLHRGAEFLLPLTALTLGTLARWIRSDNGVWWHNEVSAFRAEAETWEATAIRGEEHV